MRNRLDFECRLCSHSDESARLLLGCRIALRSTPSAVKASERHRSCNVDLRTSETNPLFFVFHLITSDSAQILAADFRQPQQVIKLLTRPLPLPLLNLNRFPSGSSSNIAFSSLDSDIREQLQHSQVLRYR